LAPPEDAKILDICPPLDDSISKEAAIDAVMEIFNDLQKA